MVTFTTIDVQISPTFLAKLSDPRKAVLSEYPKNSSTKKANYLLTCHVA